MIEHLLFPTLLGEFHYPKNDEFKELFYQHIWNHMDEDGFSYEVTGHVSIHHEPAFADLFMFGVNSVKEYVRRYHIDPDLFDYNVTKSWMNITKNGPTPLHNHADAHISFAYYINIPTEFTKPIRFHNFYNRYEPFPGSVKFNNPAKWDTLNSYTWEFNPVEGQMFVFPSGFPHETGGARIAETETGSKTREELEQKRICLACDILLTYKEISPKPMGVQPLSNWRRFV